MSFRRRYFGHKPTIRPNAKKLYKLFLNRSNITWEDFASRVQISQKGFMGEPNEIISGRGEFHENPAACICDKSEGTSYEDGSQESNIIRQDQMGNKGDGSLTDDEQDVSDSDYSDAEYISVKVSKNPFLSNLLKSEEPHFEELLSD